MDLHGLEVKKVPGNGSKSRYLGQLIAIRDYAESPECPACIDTSCQIQELIDYIFEAGNRYVNLLRDIVKFNDFLCIESGEPVVDSELVNWYKTQWWQIEKNHLVYEAAQRFGGKRNLAELIGLSYNTVNRWYSMRELISNPKIEELFRRSEKIEDQSEFRRIARSILSNPSH
jgi:hypothetical protein